MPDVFTMPSYLSAQDHRGYKPSSSNNPYIQYSFSGREKTKTRGNMISTDLSMTTVCNWWDGLDYQFVSVRGDDRDLNPRSPRGETLSVWFYPVARSSGSSYSRKWETPPKTINVSTQMAKCFCCTNKYQVKDTPCYLKKKPTSPNFN